MTPEPIAIAGLTVAQVWLDALSSRTCDEEAFLRAMQAITQRSPEEGWNCLSLLDQYYRRGKISSETFGRLKNQLGNQLMNPSGPASAREPTAVPTAVPTSAPTSAPTLARKPAPAPEAPSVASAIAAASAPQSVPVLSSAIPISSGGAPREVNVGDVVKSRYVIKSVIGRGGTGPVFEAIDRFPLDLQDGGQRVALMVLDAKISERPELVRDLRREFQVMQSLSHPNIVRTYGYDRDGDTEFFAMEYLSGLRLASVLSAREDMPLERPDALAILRDVGAALAHGHSRGVVHGDLSAGKVFITNDGEVRLLNFGSAPDSVSFTGPLYASCQVLDGAGADARDDIYSCACLMYVLLSGSTPFGDQTAIQARAQLLKPGRPKRATAREWRALRAALSFDRDQRPADIVEWLQHFDLREAKAQLPTLLVLTRGRPRPSRRSRVPAIGVLLLGLLAAGWWAGGHPGLRQRDVDALSVDATSAIQNAGHSMQGPVAPAPSAARPPVSGTVPAAAPAEPTSEVPSTSPAVQAPPPPMSTRTLAADAAAAAPAPQAAAPRTAGGSLRSHIELAADTVDVRLGDPAARILVRRSGNLRGDLTFSWWTESGTAKPGQDYATVSPHEEHIEDGKSFVNLYIPVVADSTRREPKSFYVVIRDPPEGTTLGRNLVMVTIPSSEE